MIAMCVILNVTLINKRGGHKKGVINIIAMCVYISKVCCNSKVCNIKRGGNGYVCCRMR